ncbi:hypothetical protein [Methylobacterium marchantiae]|uniref:Calcium-binding protein n=1 Tax=Methylobacterium marchantiae TaxID=600331 RepID=A0ABW3WWS0_9HYPH|nr:hypothetical protein AIGOOFII_3688 [Methylobacterium marchantiae]
MAESTICNLIADGDTYLNPSDQIDTVDFRNDELFSGTHGAGIDVAVGTATDTSEGTDTLTSIESVIGSVFADAIAGSKSANTLSGGAGDDSLDGLADEDVLTGGTGRDTFHFRTTFSSANVDHITDSKTVDIIEIAHAIATTPPVGVLAAEAFKDLSNGSVDATGRILYDPTSGALSYDKDCSGSTSDVTFATLDHPIALTDLDFHIA